MTKPDLVLLHAPSNHDFRKRAVMHGPISDVIPSTPLFEMYPIGFVSIAGYLEQHGLQARIVNIANRMLQDPDFDVEDFIGRLPAVAFGIDLHWLPHAQGSLRLAELVKQQHPQTPVIMGGLSATYFHQQLIDYPQVDYVVRGDSTEAPVLELVKRIKAGASVEDIPNLTWKDGAGAHYNPLSHVPSQLSDVPLDYGYPIRSVVKYRDLASVLPFKGWLDYPITAALTCRGCSHECITCGGSRYAYRNTCNRGAPAYRDPKLVARDIQSIQRFLKGPVFVIGDIRQAGEDYADQVLQAMKAKRVRGPIVLELFNPAPATFFQKVKKAIPDFSFEMSPESHDETVRHAFGKGYNNRDLEETIKAALESGCRKFDLFFMIGLPRQTSRSVMDTAAYCRTLLKEFKGKGRLQPMISPLAPFVDPGSRVFEDPDKYGYRLRLHTLEEHRQALLSPSWKYMLNYETEWLSRAQIVETTYEAGIAFNSMKRDFGLISPQAATAVETRARQAVELMETIDRIVAQQNPELEEREMARLKELMEQLTSTTCLKKELEWPAVPFFRNLPRMLWAFCTGRASGAL